MKIISKLLHFFIEKKVKDITPPLIFKQLQNIENKRRYRLRKKFIPILSRQISSETSIFCNNCFGARISQDLGYPYNSPIAGLKFPQEDYHTLLENISYIKGTTIKSRSISKYDWFSEYDQGYPIGYIELNGHDVEIHLVHYKSIEEANIKWRRRCERINFDNLLLIETNYSHSSEKDVERFFALPYGKKVYFSSKIMDIKKENYFFIEECKNRWLAPYAEAHLLYKYLIRAK